MVPVEILQKFARVAIAQKAARPAKASQGERRIAQAIGPFNQSPGIGGSSINAYEQILHFRTCVFQCVNFKAERFAECAVQVVKKAKGGERQKHSLHTKAFLFGRGIAPEPRRWVSKSIVTKAASTMKPHEDYEYVEDDDPLARLMSDPNEPDTGFPFWYLSEVFFELCGDAYLFKSRDTARRVESLWVLPTQWMRPVCQGRAKLVDYYECQPMRGVIEKYDPDDIIRIRRPSPFHPLAAMSATNANAAEIDTYDQISAVQNTTLQNRVNFSGILRAEEGVGSIDPDKIHRIELAIAQRYGGVYNSGRPLILEPGWLWEGMPAAPDLAMKESKAEQRKLIMQGYGLDEAFFAANESTDAAAWESRLKVRLQVTEVPRRLYAEALTERLAREEFGDEYRIIYPDTPIQTHEEKIAEWAQLSQFNRVTINEHRTAFSLEPDDNPEADEIMVAPNLVPLSMSADAAMADHPAGNDGGDGSLGNDRDASAALDDEEFYDHLSEITKAFDETKHRRGDTNNAGHFARTGSESSKKKPSKKPTAEIVVKKPSDGGTSDHPGAAHGSAVTVKPSKERAFNGKDPVEVQIQLTKQETGRVGEAVGLAYLKHIGLKDARPMNVGTTNFAVDLIEDHRPTEVKAGLVSNTRGAQQWRLTFSKESKKEIELYDKMNERQRAAWNEKKQQRIHERKKAVIAAIEKESGQKIKPRTLTVAINPDTKIADIYIFDGFHDRIDWQSDQAKAGYQQSVKYG